MMKSILMKSLLSVFGVSFVLCVLALVPAVESLPIAGPGDALFNGVIRPLNFLKPVADAMWPMTVLVAVISVAGLWLVGRFGGGGVL